MNRYNEQQLKRRFILGEKNFEKYYIKSILYKYRLKFYFLKISFIRQFLPLDKGSENLVLI